MGSVCETIKEYLDTVRELPYGLICVHLYRPFSVTHFTACLPNTATQVTVLSRTKEPGAPGEPLYLDVAAVLLQSGRTCRIFSGRYGLSSRDTTPAQISAVFSNTRKSIFTVGIEDDVTHLSLSVPAPSETVPCNTAAAVSDSSRTSHTISCKFWGLGGTVLSALPKTPSNSSGCILLKMYRAILNMIPKNQEDLLSPTFVLEPLPSGAAI